MVIARAVADLIAEGSDSPVIKTRVVELLRDRGLPLYPLTFDIASVIYEFVNVNVNYIKDQKRVEFLQSAERILKLLYGDCDEKVILAGSMLRSIGFEVAIVLLDIDGSGTFQHIYLMLKLGDKVYPFDPTIVNGYVGKQVSSWSLRRILVIY